MKILDILYVSIAAFVILMAIDIAPDSLKIIMEFFERMKKNEKRNKPKH